MRECYTEVQEKGLVNLDPETVFCSSVDRYKKSLVQLERGQSDCAVVQGRAHNKAPLISLINHGHKDNLYAPYSRSSYMGI